MKTLKRELPYKLNLQFFSNPDDGGDNPSDDSKKTDKDDTKKDELMIPKKRFDEINDKYKSAQSQLDDFIKKQQEQEKQSKEEQGKFEELYKTANGELEGYKTKNQEFEGKVKELEGVIQGLLDTKLESIPEELHEIIPANLSIVEKLDWINKAESKGILKSVKSDNPLGGATNFKQENDIDFTKYNPQQLMSMGYSKK